jgi:ketosteroid isomerase-like protein
MKRFFLIAVLVLAACGRAFGDPASDERELTQLVKDLNAAVAKPDALFLERILHRDYVHHNQRGLAEDRSQYVENRKTGRVAYNVLEWNDIKVRLNGDTAFVTGRATAKGKDQHGAFDDQRLFTRVFVRQDGRWQLVHSQATPIRAAAARPAEEGQLANSRDQADVERELTQLVKELNRAIVAGDHTFLDRILHQDYIHFRPAGTVENRAQYVDNRRTGRVDYDSVVENDMKVRVYGDTAVVTYRSAAKGKDPEGAIDEERRSTHLFVRRDGRWQLVHTQVTPIQKP